MGAFSAAAAPKHYIKANCQKRLQVRIGWDFKYNFE
jgi:hypothetical protein